MEDFVLCVMWISIILNVISLINFGIISNEKYQFGIIKNKFFKEPEVGPKYYYFQVLHNNKFETIEVSFNVYHHFKENDTFIIKT